MLRQYQLVKLEDPAEADVEYVRAWMRRPDLGNIQLNGVDEGIWRNTNFSDLVAIDARRPDDDLTRWVNEEVLDKYDYLIGRHLPNVRNRTLRPIPTLTRSSRKGTTIASKAATSIRTRPPPGPSQS